MGGLVIYLFASLLLGTLLCFFGKKYIPFLFVTLSIVIFLAIITKFGFHLKSVLIAIVICLIICLIIRLVLRLGLFLIGAVCGVLLVVDFFPLPISSHTWVIAILAFLVGLCYAIWRDNFISLVIAYAGSSIILKPILFFVINLFYLQSFVYADGSVVTFLKLN